jgi:hypothetical protein
MEVSKVLWYAVELDVDPLPCIASDAPMLRCDATEVVYGVESRLCGHPSLSVYMFTTYIGLAANGRTVPNKLLEQADAAMALAANTSYASTR